jgi:iron complex outermembrane receptor protein
LVAKNLSIDLKIVFQDREGTYTRFYEGNGGEEVNYKPFWMFDTKMIYSRQKWNVYLSVNNLFNVFYYDIGNVAQPGRWMKAGFLYRLDLN